MTRVLVVDDEPAFGELLHARLSTRRFSPIVRQRAEDALLVLDREPVDVVVTDLRMPGTDGATLCSRIVANRPDIPVIVLTGFGSLETAVSAIRAGAFDFLTKPVEIDALVVAIERAASHRALREEVKRLRNEVRAARSSLGLDGTSAPMVRLREELLRVADTEAPALITGETGVGKESVARALHAASRREGRPFVVHRCDGPERTLERDLFDAFTRAHGGTLLLDEVAELPHRGQTIVLRAIEQRTIRTSDDVTDVAVDVRVIGTTKRDVDAALEEGALRDDLYFRLTALPIAVPPLRSRGADVLLLAQQIVRAASQRLGKNVVGISPPAAERLAAYSWPGNLRELRNALERAVALAQFEELRVDDLPEKVQRFARSHVVVASDDPEELVSLAELEKRYVLRVLEAAGDNRSQAARILQVDRRTLYRKLESYGLETRKGA